MHGLARGGVKHVCSTCLLRARQQTLTNSQATSVITVSPSISLTQTHPLDPLRRVASLSTYRKIRNNPPLRIRCVSHGGSKGAAKQPVFELSDSQQQKLHQINRLRRRVTAVIDPSSKTYDINLSSNDNNSTLDAVLNSLPAVTEDHDVELVGTLRERYGGQSATSVDLLLRKIAIHRRPSHKEVSNEETVQALVALGILSSADVGMMPTKAAQEAVKPVRSRGTLMSSLQRAQEARKANIAAKASGKRADSSSAPATSVPSRSSQTQTIDPRDLVLEPLDADDNNPRVPRLSFDLSRVLFNPGVYQLQDPRSRVFNFDPYLATPMPLTEFNFGALNEYITSSKDRTLISYALAHNKRYIGSSSSMSGALCHFHFLLSQWRELNTVNLTRGFSEERADFTAISKSPAAVFLRWRDGVYAVDADKEFDEPNVLLSLGKSMEKLLTLERSDFEKWRKTGTDADKTLTDSQSEAYHYSTQGDFLLRSQLDAQDPRLPGSGIFDLKTRAVAAIRMNVQDHESGMGYQIKDRFGTWESFEREYYDMMRSAFLKYSMQVRMGNMDGIFVAYHNIQRLFGFQYIPITELDLVLHGQSDPSIGDQEFRMSIGLMDEIFDIATAKFPEQSIRFHFETRDANARESKPHMHIFAEPMTHEEIDAIQAARDLEFDAYEKRVTDITSSAVASRDPEQPAASPPGQAEPDDSSSSSLPTSGVSLLRSSESSDANSEVLDRVLQQVSPTAKPPQPRPLLALKLTISNKVNGIETIRPEQITADAQWTIDYALDEIPDGEARKLYITSKSRRMAALRTGARQGNAFLAGMGELSRSGAVWRQEQDEIDARRERVMLYPK